MKKRIAVLVSGGGTNLQALLEAEEAGKIPHGEIAMVISNNPGAYALERAKNFGVPAAVISKKELGSQEAFERELQAVLERNGTDLIILAGFMCILSERFPSLPDSFLLRRRFLRPAGPSGSPGLRREGHRRHRPLRQRDPRRR